MLALDLNIDQTINLRASLAGRGFNASVLVHTARSEGRAWLARLVGQVTGKAVADVLGGERKTFVHARRRTSQATVAV